jgi:hypothetical protein
MIGFLIKKNFFDLWDNLFRVALVNIGFILVLAVPVFFPSLLSEIPALSLIVMFTGILICFIYLCTASLTLKAVSDYGSFGFADFFNNLKASLPAALVMALIVFLAYMLVTLVIPFYLSMGSMIGLVLAAVIFWSLIVAILALQFFFAVRARLSTEIPKVIKKCFIIFFDNPMFSIFVLLHNIVMLVLSTIVAFIFPGPAGLLLFLDQGLRLRLLKYDWLEENPEANKKDVPWDALLIDERDKTGTRSLRNFIFPWKD